MTKITKEDKDKLRQVLQYLKNTINYRRIMGEESIIELFIWVNAAYGVHPNLKSYIVGCMKFGYGMVHCKSVNQKLNTKISTKAKVVLVSDYLPYNIYIFSL